jgi:hypothetical protein
MDNIEHLLYRRDLHSKKGGNPMLEKRIVIRGAMKLLAIYIAFIGVNCSAAELPVTTGQ